MIQHLFDIFPKTREVFALSLLPAMLNACIFIYATLKLEKTKGNSFFILFVFLLTLWQVAEFFVRVSLTVEGAAVWYKISSIFSLFLLIAGNFFVFRFTGIYRNIPQTLLFLAYIVPAFFFIICIELGYNEADFHLSEKWLWTANPRSSSVISQLISLWIMMVLFTMLVPIWNMYFKTPGKSIRKKQFLLLALSLSFPILPSILFEQLFPLVFHFNRIPVAAASSTLFTLAAAFTMARYKMYEFSPRHHWNDIVNSITDGVIITNHKGQIMYANTAFYELTGYPPASLYEKHISSLVQAVSETEVQISDIRNNTIWAKSAKTDYKNKKGFVIGTINFYTNLNPIIEAKQNLKEINKELDMYVYKISHDIRGPVATMKGLINVWKADDGRNGTDYIKMLETSVKKLDETVITMVKAMSISKMNSFDDELYFSDFIDELLLRFIDNKAFNKLKIIKDITYHQPYTTNRYILETILLNLIENAINYQKPGHPNAYVRISVNETAGKLRLVVEDNGIGIKDELKDQVFDMYFRGNPASKGAGLGLYLAKKSVEKLKGEITVESEEKVGTRFIVEI